jgi:hypothetical protein
MNLNNQTASLVEFRGNKDGEINSCHITMNELSFLLHSNMDKKIMT